MILDLHKHTEYFIRSGEIYYSYSYRSDEQDNCFGINLIKYIKHE